MDELYNFPSHPSRVEACFTPNSTSVIPLEHQRVKIKLSTSYFLGDIRLKAEGTVLKFSFLEVPCFGAYY